MIIAFFLQLNLWFISTFSVCFFMLDPSVIIRSNAKHFFTASMSSQSTRFLEVYYQPGLPGKFREIQGGGETCKSRRIRQRNGGKSGKSVKSWLFFSHSFSNLTAEPYINSILSNFHNFLGRSSVKLAWISLIKVEKHKKIYILKFLNFRPVLFLLVQCNFRN